MSRFGDGHTVTGTPKKTQIYTPIDVALSVVAGARVAAREADRQTRHEGQTA